MHAAYPNFKTVGECFNGDATIVSYFAGFPGGWAGDEHNAFTANGPTPQQQDIFQHVQSLLRLRATHPALRSGDLKEIFVDQTAFVYSGTPVKRAF